MNIGKDGHTSNFILFFVWGSLNLWMTKIIVGDVGPNFSTALWAVVSFCSAHVHTPCSMCCDRLWFVKKKLKNGKQFDQIYIAHENRLIDKINW